MVIIARSGHQVSYVNIYSVNFKFTLYKPSITYIDSVNISEVKGMKKIIWVLSGLTAFTGVAAFIWFANPFDPRDRVLVSQIMKMRVAPKRVEIPKTPRDYAMLYSDVDIITEDNILLRAWEIPSPTPSDKTVIVNHLLTTTRYG